MGWWVFLYGQSVSIVVHSVFAFCFLVMYFLSCIMSIYLMFTWLCNSSSYIILNGLLDNSEINRTSSAELHERSECNSSERVRFISELSWRPFNMHIIERDPHTLEPWNWDLNKHIDAIKHNIKRIEWFSVQFGHKLNTHYSMNKSNTHLIINQIFI